MQKTDFESVATRVSAVSIAVNLILAAFKFVAGAVGHSGAMIGDAVHSSSDVLGSLIVIVGVRMSEKTSDKDFCGAAGGGFACDIRGTSRGVRQKRRTRRRRQGRK